jgi:HlyD family secretion protein
VAQSEVDAARSDFEQARAQLRLEEAAVQQARADLEDARINLAYTDIRSPVDGVVVARNVDVGQTVAASFQTPTLFLIAQDLTKMQVNTAVSESDIGHVREGQAARFTVDAYGSRSFAGTVIQVRNAPTVVQNVVTYDVVVAVDNADLDLKPGMTATVTIATAERADVLRMAVRALRFQPESSTAGPPAGGQPTGVWVVEDGRRLRRVEVEIGLRNDRHAEVLRGDLQPGMRLAVGMPRDDRASSRPPALPGAVRSR